MVGNVLDRAALNVGWYQARTCACSRKSMHSQTKLYRV